MQVKKYWSPGAGSAAAGLFLLMVLSELEKAVTISLFFLLVTAS